VNVLSLCDRTGVMLRPWADAGYRCFAVDLQHAPGTVCRDGIHFIGANLRDRWLPPRGDYAFACGFPPCTHTAVSGARWFASKGPRKAVEAFDILDACRAILEWTGAAWFIENPVSTFSTYWRKPDFTFHPWEYGGYSTPPGDGYAKRTCLWTGGGFEMPEPRPAPITDADYIHRLPPSEQRADLRSVTPKGFALAVYQANRPRRFMETEAA
jgi:hypothetical protein